MDAQPKYKLYRNPRPKLPPPPYCKKFNYSESSRSLEMHNIKVSDPGEILLLIKSMFNNQSRELEKKLNNYIETQTFAETVFLATLGALSEEAVVQVIGQKILDRELRASVKSAIFDEVISKRNVSFKHLPTLYDSFQNILKEVLDNKTNACYDIVGVPVHLKLTEGNTSPDLALLVCVVNSPKSQEFITRMVNEVCTFCLPIIISTAKLEEEAKIKRQCQSLLFVARKLFNRLGDLNDLLREIMFEARRLTQSERCAVFILDSDQTHLVARVLDGGGSNAKDRPEIKIKKDQGIAGYVATTGKLLNIKDAYTHPLFFKGIDESTGFHTRNILCFPIQDENGIVGVAQLCNKAHGDFDFFDEEVALAFGIYCGISIMNTLVYKKLKKAQTANQLSNELMLYHMKVQKQDVVKVMLCTNRHAYLDYDHFDFSPKRINPEETPCHILKMFCTLGLLDLYQIKREKLITFVLYVRKGYRDNPYHNWMHGFSVSHFAFTSVIQLKLMEKELLSPLEVLAFITSCMCHDIDHRGTTNSFQMQSGSALANLYSSEGSVMERHHLSQALCILNTEECNFLESLETDDYLCCLSQIKDNILATDLNNHFKLSDKQLSMIESGFDKANQDHNFILRSLLMTCADLSDQIKNWEVVKLIASQIYNEFFHQGDLEKSMGKIPLPMMDRDQASIPDLQIDFLRAICLPVFGTLASLFPESATCNVLAIERHIKCWEACKPVFAKAFETKEMSSLDVLHSLEMEEEVWKVLLQQEHIQGKILDNIAEATGIGCSTVACIIKKDHKLACGEKDSFTSPRKHIVQPSPKFTVDECAEEAKFRIVYSFHTTRKQNPQYKLMN